MVVDKLLAVSGKLLAKQKLLDEGVSSATLNSLVKKGVIEMFEVPEFDEADLLNFLTKNLNIS